MSANLLNNEFFGRTTLSKAIAALSRSLPTVLSLEVGIYHE